MRTQFDLIPEGKYPATVIGVTKRTAKPSGTQILDFKIQIGLPDGDHFVFWTQPGSHSLLALFDIPRRIHVTIRHAYLGRIIRNEVVDVAHMNIPKHPKDASI